MNGDVEVEASRPRPLSGGIWTLFSWLRRSERSSSSESVSSVGSDRTAASFDFLSPIHYRHSAPPLILTSNSPTDSYKKRVHERNLRRQRERDITLHRKYGLWREDGGYDAFSLPPVYKNTSDSGNKQGRCRRAASECLPRRAAYVPGKRRAPLPPNTSLSLPRNYKRKRPAPKPPAQLAIKNKKNLEINHNQLQMNPVVSESSHSKTFESERSKPNKETKLRSERNFIKQIFENKKRNSAIEISQVKLLPSISELDKQAAEIIETNKMIRSLNSSASEDDNVVIEQKILPSGNMWMCTKCLRKYNITIKSCVYCVPKQNKLNYFPLTTSTQTDSKDCKVAITNSRIINENEEKKKLKEMLKEMKDSLPKKSMGGKLGTHLKIKEINQSTETPTLRIGSSIDGSIKEQNKDEERLNLTQTSDLIGSKKIIHNDRVIHHYQEIPLNKIHKTEISKNNYPLTSNATSSSGSTQKNEIQDKKEIASSKIENESYSKIFQTEKNGEKATNNDGVSQASIAESSKLKSTKILGKPNIEMIQSCSTALNTNMVGNISIHTPLKISSLLNPIYLPKNSSRNEMLSSTHTMLDDPKNIPKSDLVNIKEPSKTNISDSSSSNNKCRLEPEIVSQIIKKSMEEKEKRKQQKDFKNKTENLTVNSECDHAVRRDLINQLELSIAKGDEKAAAEAAVRLAKLRLSCSVLSFSSQIVAGTSKTFLTNENGNSLGITNIQKLPQREKSQVDTQLAINSSNKQIIYSRNNSHLKKNEENNVLEGEKRSLIETDVLAYNNSTDNKVSIEIWIEDKIAARGPVQLNISRSSTIADLRKEAENSFGLAVRLQRWIVGKTLCTDDTVPIISLAGSDFTAPFYLCLVESDVNKIESNANHDTEKESINLENNASGEFYTELIKLEQQALVSNSESFECGVCMEDCAIGNGAILRECIHTFCRECLSDAVRHCEEPVVPCPAIGCPGVLQDREIRALLSEDDYDKWLARGLAAAESGTRNTFHCRTTDCTGWAFCEPGVRRFPCPVCEHTNCVPCQAVHEGVTCEEYQKKLRETVTAAENNNTDDTQTLLNSLISRGEALECPECRAIITKKWGCDWVKCSACKTEICWITKGRRWGPAGRGDTSAGCRCGVDGKRCHPSCGYCH